MEWNNVIIFWGIDLLNKKMRIGKEESTTSTRQRWKQKRWWKQWNSLEKMKPPTIALSTQTPQIILKYHTAKVLNKFNGSISMGLSSNETWKFKLKSWINCSYGESKKESHGFFSEIWKWQTIQQSQSDLRLMLSFMLLWHYLSYMQICGTNGAFIFINMFHLYKNWIWKPRSRIEQNIGLLWQNL